AVQRIPVLAEGPLDEAVVVRVAGGGEQHPVESDAPVVVVHLVLVAIPPGDLDGHAEFHDTAPLLGPAGHWSRPCHRSVGTVAASTSGRMWRTTAIVTCAAVPASFYLIGDLTDAFPGILTVRTSEEDPSFGPRALAEDWERVGAAQSLPTSESAAPPI